MNKIWSKCSDANRNVECFKVGYPWPLMPIHRAWAQNRESELDVEFEREAQPLLKQFLKQNDLVWNVESFGEINLSTFVAYFSSGGYLITPVSCYANTQMPVRAERIQMPLSAIPY